MLLLLTKLCLLFILISLYFFAIPASGLAQPEASQTRSDFFQTPYHTHVQYGWPLYFVSDKLYENFQIISYAFAVEKPLHFWSFLKKTKIRESVLLEWRLAKIWGKNIPLCQDQMSEETWNRFIREGRTPSTDWDHHQLGLIPYYRWSYPIASQTRMYGEIAIGLTYLNKPLIEDGTKWNILFGGGLGLEWKIKDWPFYTFARFEHFCKGDGSNYVINKKRNIGPEAIFIGIGVHLPK
jgi:hypothetical protein